MGKLALHWQILLALILAILAGSLTGMDTVFFGVNFYSIYEFIGALFLNALKMLIVPLIASSIICGIVGVGGSQHLGRLGMKTIIYYMTTSLLAILTGLVLVNLIAPGVIDGNPAKATLGLSSATDTVMDRIGDRGAGDVVEVFLRMVPPNVVAAAVEGNMLGLIFFSILFGYFITRIGGPAGDAQKSFWEGVFAVMMKITDLIMKFAPVGVFALVAKVVASTGLAAMKPLLLFMVTVLGALAFHLIVTMGLILRFGVGVNPWRHFKTMLPALFTAFSTASSSATLPLTMDCVEKGAGVSNRTTSFVLPLGATINMDGTALYECVAAMFIAQAYGLDISLGTQFTIVLVALLTSIGVAGIPAASLVAITIILGAIGLPLEGIGLILAVDRVLDMCRTAVNIFGDSTGAVFIGRLEGEKQIYQEQVTQTTT